MPTILDNFGQAIHLVNGNGRGSAIAKTGGPMLSDIPDYGRVYKNYDDWCNTNDNYGSFAEDTLPIKEDTSWYLSVDTNLILPTWVCGFQVRKKARVKFIEPGNYQ